MPLITTQSARGYGWGALVDDGPGDFESIASFVGGTGIDTISFTSIPQTYKHLELRYNARSAGGTNQDCSVLLMNFNSDTGSNYSRATSVITTTSRVVGNGANENFADAGLVMGSAALADSFTAGIVTIEDYTNTSKYKHWQTHSGATQGTNSREGLVWTSWGSWVANTNAITRIDLKVAVGNAFTSNSVFALYGMKG
jgi:hypothetical protein